MFLLHTYYIHNFSYTTCQLFQCLHNFMHNHSIHFPQQYLHIVILYIIHYPQFYITINFFLNHRLLNIVKLVGLPPRWTRADPLCAYGSSFMCESTVMCENAFMCGSTVMCEYAFMCGSTLNMNLSMSKILYASLTICFSV